MHKRIPSRLAKVKLIKGFDGIIAQFRGLQKVDQVFLKAGAGYFGFVTRLESRQIDQKDSLGTRISK